MRQAAVCVFGKAMTSRMACVPVMSMTSRSIPRAIILRKDVESVRRLSEGSDLSRVDHWSPLFARLGQAKPRAIAVDLIMEPVTGKAVPVYRGEVLRISQVVGGQCVDFNAYNLHDYKEWLDNGFNRMTSLETGQGTIIWSGCSRARPMYAILKMAETCDQFYAGFRCHALLNERQWGLVDHPNCQDTFAEVIREYGLTPDDVHDSYNLWMSTEVDSQGRRRLPINRGQHGDQVDLLALFDTLAVPIVCGHRSPRTAARASTVPPPAIGESLSPFRSRKISAS